MHAKKINPEKDISLYTFQATGYGRTFILEDIIHDELGSSFRIGNSTRIFIYPGMSISLFAYAFIHLFDFREEEREREGGASMMRENH